MSSTRTIHDITDLAPGDHLCWFYDTEEDHRAVITPFLRQGLERGEKVLYIVDARTAEAVPAYLRENGLEVEPYLARAAARDRPCPPMWISGMPRARATWRAITCMGTSTGGLGSTWRASRSMRSAKRSSPRNRWPITSYRSWPWPAGRPAFTKAR